MLQETIQNQKIGGCVGEFWGPNRPQKLEKKWDRNSDVSRHVLKEIWGAKLEPELAQKRSAKMEPKTVSFSAGFRGLELILGPLLGFILASFSLSLGVVLGTPFEKLSEPLLALLSGLVSG